MTSWCQKRITNAGLRVQFGNETQLFFLESVCGKPVEDNEPLCTYCRTLAPQTRVQVTMTFQHGLVTEPYTKESHIFDSPWYHEKVKAYGAPPQSILDLAMEAQRRARAGIKNNSLADCLLPLSKSSSSLCTDATNDSTDTKSSPKQASRKKSQKPNQSPTIQELPTPKPIRVLPSSCTCIESTDTMIPIKTIQRKTLKSIMVQSIRYWMDDETNHLYSVSSTGKRGQLVGILDDDTIIPA